MNLSSKIKLFVNKDTFLYLLTFTSFSNKKYDDLLSKFKLLFKVKSFDTINSIFFFLFSSNKLYLSSKYNDLLILIPPSLKNIFLISIFAVDNDKLLFITIFFTCKKNRWIYSRNISSVYDKSLILSLS